MCVAKLMRFLQRYVVSALFILVVCVALDARSVGKVALLPTECVARYLQASTYCLAVATFGFPVHHSLPLAARRPKRVLTRSRRMNYIRRMKTDADKRIDTVAKLVKALGGTFALAKWADVVPSTVSNWKEQDAIPPGWHLRLYLECANRKLNVAPKLFGIEDKAKNRRPRALASQRLVSQHT